MTRSGRLSRSEVAKLPTGSAPELLLSVQLAQAGIPFVREHRFAAPERQWRFDFAFIDRKVAVEIEGGHWANGAHMRGRHFESDIEKYNQASLRGWMLGRFTTEMVNDGRCLAWIREAIGAKAA